MARSLNRTELLTGDLVWLLEVDFAGRTFRWSSRPIDVVDDEGDAASFEGGLDAVELEQALSTLSDTPELLSVPFELFFPVDVAELIEQGHDLSAATGELSLMVVESGYATRQVLVAGRVSEPEYSAEDEPVAFSLVEEPYDDVALVPEPTAKISRQTWANRHHDARGLYYPQVHGNPGVWFCVDEDPVTGDTGVLTFGPATKAPIVDWNTGTSSADMIMASDGRVQAQRCVVFWRGGSVPDGWEAMDLTLTTDALGRECTVVDTSSLVATDATEWFIAWHPAQRNELFFAAANSTTYTFNVVVNGTAYPVTYTSDGSATASEIAAGLVTDVNDPTVALSSFVYAVAGATSVVIYSRPGFTFSTVTIANITATTTSTGHAEYGYAAYRDNGPGGIRGLGDELYFWANRSTMPLDRGAWEALIPALNAFQVVAYPEGAVNPWEYMLDNLLPIAPVTIHSGPNGLYPVLWRFDATSKDAVDHIIFEPGVERVSRIEYDRPTYEVINEIRLDWAYLELDDDAGFQRTTTIRPDPNWDTVEDITCMATLNSALRYNRQRLHEPTPSRSETMESNVIADEATAHLVLAWQILAKGFAHRVIRYRLGQEFGWLELGDVVLLTDDDLHLDSVVALVQSVAPADAGRIELALQLVDNPTRESVSHPPNPIDVPSFGEAAN
jgi:hypothetical protein